MHGSVERKIKIPELLIFGHRRRLGFCIPLWLFSFCIWDMDISYDHDRIVVVDLPMLQCLNAQIPATGIHRGVKWRRFSR